MMSLIQSLCILLVTAHLFGRLAVRIGQPELIGHMLAGIVLGPALLNWVHAGTGLNAIADLAVLFVVIVAGLEMRLRSVTRMFHGRGVLALLPSFVLPALMGGVLARYFDFDWTGSVVVALCVSVTALPVALRILSSFGLLGTQLAQVTIAGALLADVVVLICLSMLSPPTAVSATPLPLLLLLGLSALKLMTLLALVAAGAWLCKTIYQRHAWQPQRLASTQLSFALLLILLLAAASEALGLHFAIGAFLGALMVSEYHSEQQDGVGGSHPLRPQLEGISHLIFAPLFLAAQGTHFTLSSLNQPAFTLSVIVVAIASKLIGGYWSARWQGLSREDAKGVAIVMNARGVMEMVVASIAYRAGLVDQTLFSTLLIVGIVTTLLTPLLLKRWQKQQVLLSAAKPAQP